MATNEQSSAAADMAHVGLTAEEIAAGWRWEAGEHGARLYEPGERAPDYTARTDPDGAWCIWRGTHAQKVLTRGSARPGAPSQLAAIAALRRAGILGPAEPTRAMLVVDSEALNPGDVVSIGADGSVAVVPATAAEPAAKPVPVDMARALDYARCLVGLTSRADEGALLSRALLAEHVRAERLEAALAGLEERVRVEIGDETKGGGK